MREPLLPHLRPLPALLSLALLATALTLGACGDDDGEGAPAASAYPLTIRDDTDTTVTISTRPQRIVAVLPSATNLLVDLDLASLIIGTDSFSKAAHAEDEGAPLADVQSVGGSGFRFNLELIAQLEPDLALVGLGGTEDFVDQLRTLGITVVALRFPQSIEEMLEQLLLIGEIDDATPEAEALVAELRGRIEIAQGQGRERRELLTYIEIDQSEPTRPWTVGSASLHQEIIEVAGGENAFANLASDFAQVSWKEVIAANPDVILLLNSTEYASELAFNPVSTETVGTRTGWDQIAAVQNGRIFALDPDLFSTGVRLIEAVEQVAATLDAAQAE